jgi:hypothetical protein
MQCSVPLAPPLQASLGLLLTVSFGMFRLFRYPVFKEQGPQLHP